MDLGFTENSYTWSNKRWGADYIKQHLDRDIANISWRLAFPKVAIYHLGALNSDHAPFLIDTNPQHPFTIRLFQFQAIWTRDSRCGEVISKAWEKDHLGSTCFNFYSKQFNTTSTLKIWNREVFGVCQIKINEFSVKLEEVQKRPANEFNARLEADIQAELNEWLLWNELMWRQKSRETWLKEGNRNSRFFHLSTIIRRGQNSIDAIKLDNGDWILNKNEI